MGCHRNITKILMLLTLTQFAATIYYNDDHTIHDCGRKYVVCVGPMEYKFCIKYDNGSTFSSGESIRCPVNSRCVNDGVEICVRLLSTTAKPLTTESVYNFKPIQVLSGTAAYEYDDPVSSNDDAKETTIKGTKTFSETTTQDKTNTDLLQTETPLKTTTTKIETTVEPKSPVHTTEYYTNKISAETKDLNDDALNVASNDFYTTFNPPEAVTTAFTSPDNMNPSEIPINTYPTDDADYNLKTTTEMTTILTPSSPVHRIAEPNAPPEITFNYEPTMITDTTTHLEAYPKTMYSIRTTDTMTDLEEYPKSTTNSRVEDYATEATILSSLETTFDTTVSGIHNTSTKETYVTEIPTAQTVTTVDANKYLKKTDEISLTKIKATDIVDKIVTTDLTAEIQEQITVRTTIEATKKTPAELNSTEPTIVSHKLLETPPGTVIMTTTTSLDFKSPLFTKAKTSLTTKAVESFVGGTILQTTTTNALIETPKIPNTLASAANSTYLPYDSNNQYDDNWNYTTLKAENQYLGKETDSPKPTAFDHSDERQNSQEGVQCVNQNKRSQHPRIVSLPRHRESPGNCLQLKTETKHSLLSSWNIDWSTLQTSTTVLQNEQSELDGQPSNEDSADIDETRNSEENQEDEVKFTQKYEGKHHLSKKQKKIIKKFYKMLKNHKCKEDDVYADFKDCRKYYRCIEKSDEMIFEHLQCDGENNSFDTKKEKCVKKEKANCFTLEDLFEKFE